VKLKSRFTLNRVWLFFFGVWLILLSGVLDFWLKTPGLKQWYRVGATLEERRQEIGVIESRSAYLNHVARELNSNPIAQEREVRKVLGYLGEQEAVFEFPADSR
jgi:hypothetical protein